MFFRFFRCEKLSFFLAFSALPFSSLGMDFSVEIIGGEPAIIAVGDIVSGDAQRLRSVLTPAAKHSGGYYALALDSLGGSVQSAFEITKVMDSEFVNTYIPPGFRCASACAAIVFIAGREHVVIEGGYLGFHGCYNAINKESLPWCNEEMAKHAIWHGTAYGSIMAFVRDVPYNEMLWFDQEQADCWGISHYTISPKPDNHEKCVWEVIEKVTKKL